MHTKEFKAADLSFWTCRQCRYRMEYPTKEREAWCLGQCAGNSTAAWNAIADRYICA